MTKIALHPDRYAELKYFLLRYFQEKDKCDAFYDVAYYEGTPIPIPDWMKEEGWVFIQRIHSSGSQLKLVINTEMLSKLERYQELRVEIAVHPYVEFKD